jgi:hypothetical protein
LQVWVLSLSELVFKANTVKLTDLEQCPIRLTIHTAKKIDYLEKIAKNNPELLPPLEIAILENDKKYIIKRHSVYKALQRAGITEFNANFHPVKNLIDVIILHARMSQASPVNPLSVLDLRDYLIANGVDINTIPRICCLDPTYEKLLSCVLSNDAKKQLEFFLDLLSLKLNRIVIPSYIIEMLSKKPLNIQADIVKSIFESINDHTIMNDKDFVFPNPDQIRLYMDLYKTPQERTAILFEEEIQNSMEDSSHKKTQTNNYSITVCEEKKKEAKTIVGNISHMALMYLGDKRYRIDWKNKTFAEILESKKDNFIIIRDSTQLQKLYVLSPKQIKFLGIIDDAELYSRSITNSKQLQKVIDKINKVTRFRGILIFNKKL